MIRMTFLLLVVVVLTPTYGMGQICDTYEERDFFVPNSLSTLPNQVNSLIAAEGAFYSFGDYGVARLTIDDDHLTDLSLLGGSESRGVSVSGDLLASLGDETLELMHATTGQIFYTFSISEKSVCRLDGDRLVIWDNSDLAIYDVQDPSAPELTGELEFSLPYSIIEPRLNSVVHNGRLISAFTGGGLSRRGCLAAFDLRRPDQPRTLDLITEFPFPTEGDRSWLGVTAQGDRVFFNGHTCRSSCHSETQFGFVGEILWQTDESLSWGPYCTFPHSTIESLTTWNDQILAWVRYSSYSSSSYSIYQISLPAFSAVPIMVESRFNGQGGYLASIPEQSLLTVGSSIQNMWSLDHSEPSQNPGYSGIMPSVLLERDGLGYQLTIWDGEGPMNPSSWGVGVYDLSSNPPQRLDSYSEFWHTESEISLVGNRLYLSSGYQYLDISDPNNIGEPQDSEFPLGKYAMDFNGIVVASNNNAELCGYLPGPDESLQLLWTLSVPQGRLYRLGDHLIVSGSSTSRIVDLSEPLNPPSPESFPGGGVFRVGPENSLLVAKGTTLKWYDHTVLTSPQFIGSWEMGTLISDLVVSGDRVYVGLKDKGLSVLEFDRQQGFRLIGGELNQTVSQLILLGSALWPGNDVTLPLECNDPLPTLISRFSLEKSGSEMWVSWNAEISGSSVGEFQLIRTTPVGEKILVRMPLRNGEYRVQDPGPFDEGSLQYRLELCTHSGGCFTLAEIQGEGPGPVSQKTHLTFSPNPANPGTLVQFNLTRQEDVTLDVYTLAGKHVTRLVHGTLPTGQNTVFWDGTDLSGRTVSSGVYLFALESENQRFTGRVVVAK